MKFIKRLIIFIVVISIAIIIFQKLDIKNKILKQIYRTKYSEYVEKYAEEYDIDKYLIYAVIKVESNFDADAKSGSGAIGLMQLMDSTAKEVATKMELEYNGEEDLYNPETNIKLGVKYLSYLIEKYDGTELAIVAYNAGIGNVDKWIEEQKIQNDASDLENIPFVETNNYIRKILRDYEIYKDLYK